MVDILGLLPVLNGWNWIRINDDITLNPTDEPEELYASGDNELGWLVSARMSSNVSDMDLRIRYDPVESGQTLDFNLNPEELHAKGYTYPSNMPYVSDYDPSGSIYSSELIPNPPLAMKGRITITAAPGSSSGTMNYDIMLLQITDISAFVDSLRAIFGIQTIIDLLNSLGTPQEPKPPIELPEVTASKYTGFLP